MMDVFKDRFEQMMTKHEVEMKQQVHQAKLNKIMDSMSRDMSDMHRKMLEHALMKGDIEMATQMVAAIKQGGDAEAQSAPVRYSPLEKLQVRMGWAKGANPPMKVCLVEDSGKVFVFGVKSGESFTLVDDDTIFPSDTLVTQLRMVLNG